MLVLLLERAGDVVTHDEIRETLWPNETVVEFEHSVSSAVLKLRRALSDDAGHPRYIETLARRGYRWLVPVEWVEAVAPARRDTVGGGPGAPVVPEPPAHGRFVGRGPALS
jgi:DNA-binding winged helix-turn-helix (wHTH) protein